MIVIIDNYDSFTYNLYQGIGKFNSNIRVFYNDEMQPAEIAKLNPTHLILSPGPGRPKAAGICEDAISFFAGKLPVLGICLGHQAICECFGAEITYAKTLIHGKKSMIHVANGNPLFRGLPPLVEAGRYHSLEVYRLSLPDELLVIAETDDGSVMGVKHRDYEIYGLQFHPESILTPQGETILRNFIHIGGKEHD